MTATVLIVEDEILVRMFAVDVLDRVRGGGVDADRRPTHWPARQRGSTAQDCTRAVASPRRRRQTSQLAVISEKL